MGTIIGIANAIGSKAKQLFRWLRLDGNSRMKYDSGNRLKMEANSRHRDRGGNDA